jgi:malate dehydrogenase (oxaloacetate-decarboxylating)
MHRQERKRNMDECKRHPVVFALANPDTEIAPEDALPLVRVLATGRPDYQNQINAGGPMLLFFSED